MGGPRHAVLRRCAVFRAHLAKACASSKESSGFSKMRTFRKPVRIFEPGAHLRTRAPPWTRCRWRVKSCRPLVAASFALLASNSFRSCVQLPLERPVEVGRAISARRESLPPSGNGRPKRLRLRRNQLRLPQALSLLGRFVNLREGPAGKTAPHDARFTAWAVPLCFSLAVSYARQSSWFKINVWRTRVACAARRRRKESRPCTHRSWTFRN